MRAKNAAVLLFVFILALSSVSAIEMRRVHNFEMNEVMVYNFLGEEYTIRYVIGQPGNDGRVTLEIDGYDEEIIGDIPAVFMDLTVTFEEIGVFNATLKMVWDKELTEPDIEVLMPANFKEKAQAGSKKFDLYIKKIDLYRKRAVIIVNGEEIELGENEKTTLKDESLIKMGSLAGTSIKNVQLSIWSSDIILEEEEEEEEFDISRRISRKEQATLYVNNAPIDVMVEDITKEGKITIIIFDFIITMYEDQQVTLDNGVVVRASQLSLKIPENIMISLRVPEGVVEESGTVQVTRTLGHNQKIEFESEGKVIVVRFKEVSEDNMFVDLNVNDQNLTLSAGETGMVNDIAVTVKVINYQAYPKKVILKFDVPKKITRRQQEAKEKEEAEEEVEEVIEEEVEEETQEEIEEEIEEEIPVPKPQEEVKEEVLGFVDSLNYVVNGVLNFFLGLFR